MNIAAEVLRLLEATQKSERIVRFGTIPATYVSGRPAVLFDGETSASIKTYPYLASYAPTIGHRVALIRAGATWLIIGRVV
jgi:hypothetical protein